MAETHEQFRQRIRRERKAKAEAARRCLADYYAGSAATIAQERIARGEFTTISVAGDGSRTVTHGPGLDASGKPLRAGL